MAKSTKTKAAASAPKKPARAPAAPARTEGDSGWSADEFLRCRLATGMTQAAFATAIGYHLGHVKNVERGKKRITPKVRLAAEKVAAGLGDAAIGRDLLEAAMAYVAAVHRAAICDDAEFPAGYVAVDFAAAEMARRADLHGISREALNQSLEAVAQSEKTARLFRKRLFKMGTAFTNGASFGYDPRSVEDYPGRMRERALREAADAAAAAVLTLECATDENREPLLNLLDSRISAYERELEKGGHLKWTANDAADLVAAIRRKREQLIAPRAVVEDPGQELVAAARDYAARVLALSYAADPEGREAALKAAKASGTRFDEVKTRARHSQETVGKAAEFIRPADACIESDQGRSFPLARDEALMRAANAYASAAVLASAVVPANVEEAFSIVAESWRVLEEIMLRPGEFGIQVEQAAHNRIVAAARHLQAFADHLGRPLPPGCVPVSPEHKRVRKAFGVADRENPQELKEVANTLVTGGSGPMVMIMDEVGAEGLATLGIRSLTDTPAQAPTPAKKKGATQKGSAPKSLRKLR